MKQQLSISDFSATLFWDIDKSQVDFEKNKRFIIERTLMLGTLSDWFLIKTYYGKDTIKQEIMQVRYLDKHTLAFCAAYFNEPIENFRCYMFKQLNLSHWDY
jgi:hypothetical protein